MATAISACFLLKSLKDIRQLLSTLSYYPSGVLKGKTLGRNGSLLFKHEV